MENSSDDEPSGSFPNNHYFNNSFLLFSEYKRLKELDPDTEDKVGRLLSAKTWVYVAYKFNMDSYNVEKLLNSSVDPGRFVMEFLKRSNPNFKVLKERNIPRFDIVNVLLDHLCVSETESEECEV